MDSAYELADEVIIVDGGSTDKTVEIAQGYGGKSIAVVSFLLGLLGAAKGNLMACGSAFGVSVVAGVGPSMVTSGISALI